MLDDIVQEDELNVPPTPLSLQDMVPVGDDWALETSDTVAVRVTFPDTTEVEPGETVMAVVSLTETEMVDEPELALCDASPP